MSKRKNMPKGLQIHLLKKSIRKELKEKYSNSDIDIEAVMDKIDFEALVDNTHELDENYKTVVEFINREFGISGEDYSLIYELEKIEYEEKLKNFREILRIEFNKSGYNLNEEQFKSLLDSCVSLFPSEKFPMPNGNIPTGNYKINSNIEEIVFLLKPPARRLSEKSCF